MIYMMISDFVIATKSLKNNQRDQVAEDVKCEQANQRYRQTHIRNLIHGVSSTTCLITVSRLCSVTTIRIHRVGALEVNIAKEFVLHKRLVAVFVNRDVLELFKEDGDGFS